MGMMDVRTILARTWDSVRTCQMMRLLPQGCTVAPVVLGFGVYAVNMVSISLGFNFNFNLTTALHPGG